MKEKLVNHSKEGHWLIFCSVYFGASIVSSFDITFVFYKVNFFFFFLAQLNNYSSIAKSKITVYLIHKRKRFLGYSMDP